MQPSENLMGAATDDHAAIFENGIESELAVPASFLRESESLERNFCNRLHGWDRHVDSCSHCFADGNQLCEDGLLAQAGVLKAREAIERHTYSPRQTVDSPRPLRRVFGQVWITWAALLVRVGLSDRQ